MNILINKYSTLKEVVIISEESTAACSVLISWLYNVDPKDITIRKISDSMRGSRL